ncbi:hypothetical protein ACFQXA_07715 [Nocardiopsis composta]
MRARSTLPLLACGLAVPVLFVGVILVEGRSAPAMSRSTGSAANSPWATGAG